MFWNSLSVYLVTYRNVFHKLIFYLKKKLRNQSFIQDISKKKKKGKKEKYIYVELRCIVYSKYVIFLSVCLKHIRRVHSNTCSNLIFFLLLFTIKIFSSKQHLKVKHTRITLYKNYILFTIFLALQVCHSKQYLFYTNSCHKTQLENK